jgi:hypothetical protein
MGSGLYRSRTGSLGERGYFLLMYSMMPLFFSLIYIEKIWSLTDQKVQFWPLNKLLLFCLSSTQGGPIEY